MKFYHLGVSSHMLNPILPGCTRADDATMLSQNNGQFGAHLSIIHCDAPMTVKPVISDAGLHDCIDYCLLRWRQPLGSRMDIIFVWVFSLVYVHVVDNIGLCIRQDEEIDPKLLRLVLVVLPDRTKPTSAANAALVEGQIS